MLSNNIQNSSNNIHNFPRASIRDVAQAAGVSVSTVSLVLNRADTVHWKTRQRVESAMRQLAYRPRGAGRPVVRGRNQLVVLLYSPRTMHNGQLAPLATEWTRGVCAALSNMGVGLAAMVTTDDVNGDRRLDNLIQPTSPTTRPMAGAILIGNNPEADGYVDRLVKAGLAVVFMNRRPKFGEYSHVDIDNYGGARQAIDHLVQLGHRRIAVISSPFNVDRIQEKARGVADAFSVHGLAPVLDEKIDVEGRSDADLEPLARRVLDSGATAVFAADFLALRFIDIWQRMGLDVPGRMSVLGFDNLGIRTTSGLAITSVGYEKFTMGQMAGEMMLELLQDGRLVTRRAACVATHVVRGDTTVPPPQSLPYATSAQSVSSTEPPIH